MRIKNQKTTYAVEATNGDKKLSGEISVRDGKIIDGHLYVVNNDEEHANYWIHDDGRKNIDGTGDFISEALPFCQTEIEDFKSQIK